MSAFELGMCATTPGAIQALSHCGGDWRFNAATYLARHQDGDWGEVNAHDRKANEAALRNGTRLLSSYTLPGCGEEVWVVTEADRSSTCLLLPSEY